MTFCLVGSESWTWTNWRAIKKVLRRVDKSTRLNNATVNIAFLSREEMTQLNITYRGKSYVTDVLTFPNSMDDDFVQHLPEGEELLLGDIAISLDVAKEQGTRYGHGLEVELAVLVVHGVLHLLGIDHERSKEEQTFQAECEMTILDGADINPLAALCGRTISHH